MTDDELRRLLAGKVAAMSMLVSTHRIDEKWRERMTFLLGSSQDAIELNATGNVANAPTFLGG